MTIQISTEFLQSLGRFSISIQNLTSTPKVIIRKSTRHSNKYICSLVNTDDVSYCEFDLPVKQIDLKSLKISHEASQLTLSWSSKLLDHPLKKMNSLQWSQVTQIECNNCSNGLCRLDRTPLFERSMTLPSEHWHEMLECWACHHEDYSSTLQGQQGGLIFAQKRVVLESNGYIIVHPEDMALDNALEIVYTGNEVSIYWIL